MTLVIVTGAREGTRAALTAVVGTTLGNAVLLAAIAFGLSWVVRNAVMLFEVLRWIGAAYLIWLGIQAWRHAGETGPTAAPPSGHLHVWRGFCGCAIQPEKHRVFHRFLAAVCRSRPSGRTAARADVRRLGRTCRVHRFRLGRCGRARAGMVHALLASEIIGPAVRRGVDRRRSVALLGAAAGVAKLPLVWCEAECFHDEILAPAPLRLGLASSACALICPSGSHPL